MTLRGALHIAWVIVANVACLALCIVGGFSPSPFESAAAKRPAGTVATAPPPPEDPADAGPADAKGADHWLLTRLAISPSNIAATTDSSQPRPLPTETLVSTSFRSTLPPAVLPAAVRTSTVLPLVESASSMRVKPAADPMPTSLAIAEPSPIRMNVPAAPKVDSPDPTVVASNAIAARPPSGSRSTDDPGAKRGVPTPFAPTPPVRAPAMPKFVAQVAPAPTPPGRSSRSISGDGETPVIAPAGPRPVTMPVQD